MRQKTLDALLARLPEKDRETANRRIGIAEKFGWTSISFWEWVGSPTLDDLVAIGDRGQIHFLKDLDETGDTMEGAD
nr:hypothetical protein [uncultured Rhodopila sp.]